MTPRWPAGAPDLTFGVVVALAGSVEAVAAGVPTGQNRLPLVAVGLAMGVLAGLSRLAPGIALGGAWIVYVLQLVGGVQLMLVELSLAAVAFGCARWGRAQVVWAAGISIPVSAVVLVVYAENAGLDALLGVEGSTNLVAAARALGNSWSVIVVAAASAVLALPWSAGVALRYGARARTSAAAQLSAEQDAARAVGEAERVREIARLREQQARMARDVHDVVGHSLAVILAQAESAQYLKDTDPEALKQTMANIATSARSSLQDVRQVLVEGTAANPTWVSVRELDTLIDGMRAGGHDITATEVGLARPLPPELHDVAFRVLQEMLTNTIKHGRRGTAVSVRREWTDELRIEVRNLIAETPLGHGPLAGRGVDGMRRRLESVGGRLETLCEDGVFTARARVPVREGTP